MAINIAAYIMKNLDKPLNILVLSNEFATSRFTLQRIFKTTFGKSVHQFILEKRLEKAQKLLAKTNLPLKEIVSETGFKSITTFTKEFGNKFHITPNALRNGQ